MNKGELRWVIDELETSNFARNYILRLMDVYLIIKLDWTSDCAVVVFSKKTTANGEEVWEYNHKYWECRKSPGFVNMGIEKIW